MNPDQWRSEVARAKLVYTDGNKLLRAEELAKLAYGYSPGLRLEAESLIVGQVTVAHKRGDSAWRKSLAEKLKSVDFQTVDWLCSNVHPVSQRKSSAPQAPPEQSRDVRLKTNPNIQRTGEQQNT